MIVQLNRNWWFDLRIKTTSILKTLIGPRSKPVGPCDSDIMSKSNMKGECGQVREKKKKRMVENLKFALRLILYM